MIVRNDYISPGGTKNHDEILHDLVRFLNYDNQVKFQFSSQDWYWNVYIDGPIELPLNTEGKIIKFTLKLILTDPYKYKVDGNQNTAISDQISVVNSGTADTPIIVEARALKDTNYFMITKGDKDYFMIGDDDVETPPKNYSPNVYHSELQTLTGWNKLSTAIPDRYLGGTTGGTYKIGSTGESFVVNTFPTGTGWLGAGYKRALPKSLEDFQTTIKVIVYQKDKGAGRAVQHVYDTDNRLIASIGYENKNHDRKIGHIVVTLFNQSGEQIKIYDVQNTPNIYKMDIVVAYIRLKRVGNVYTIKSWLYDNNKDLNRVKPLNITEKKYVDKGNFYIRPISNISLYTAKYNGYDNMTMNLLGTFTTELLPKPVGANDMFIKAGDLVYIDTATQNVLVNDEPFLHEKTFGSNFFNVDDGYNELMIYPEKTFDTNVKWQDRYL